ncbi:MAG TPA: STAS domain-containing protein [Pyrinomonadaceae bacterium]|nr:STAS domain-containing protein [Pyrinomonadaceae bacterium]
MLKVHIRNLGTIAILCLQGRIIRGETDSLFKAVHSQTGVRVVILDLGRVIMVDAGGLGVLLKLREQIQANGADLKLMNVTKLVSGVLEITRLNSVFKVASTEEILAAAPRDLLATSGRLAICA